MSAYFLTLTYDSSHVHITRAGFMGLVKRDLQLFFKRLRKSHEGRRTKSGNCLRPIKYYAVGEYGGVTLRPHYHVILFNADLSRMFDSDSLRAWSSLQTDELKGKFQMQCKQWDNGHATVGSVTGASVGYTLKYVCKPGKIPMHKNDDRLKEFSLMSKGLGVSYVADQENFRWHHDDLENRKYLTLRGGKKIAMPRYYQEKLYDAVDKAKISRAMEAIMLEAAIEVIEDFDDPVRHLLTKRASLAVSFDKMYADNDRTRNSF